MLQQKHIDRLNDDIFNLQTTIRLQNNEIHRLRDEKSRNDAMRERNQASLIKENEDLKYANEELQRAYDAKTEELEVKRKVWLKLKRKKLFCCTSVLPKASKFCMFGSCYQSSHHSFEIHEP